MVARPAPAAEIHRPVHALVDRLGRAESIDVCRDLMVEAVLGFGWKILYFVSLLNSVLLISLHYESST